MTLSIVVPTFNESEGIVPFLEHVCTSVPAGLEFEIVVVDDNSPDGTASLVEQVFRGNERVRVLRNDGARSLGRSVGLGIERSLGRTIIVMDADFAHNPEEIVRMTALADTHDVVIGSRFCAGGGMENRLHYWQSRLYSRFVGLTLSTRATDNLSGFFCMPRSKLMALDFERIFCGYGDYFFRLLHFASRNGFSIVEVPVRYSTRRLGMSKSNRFRLLLSYTRAVLALRFGVR